MLLKLLYNYISTWLIRYFFPDFLSPTIVIALIELRIALIWLDWLEVGDGVELYMLLMLFYDLLIDEISYVDDISYFGFIDDIDNICWWIILLNS